MMEKTGTYTLVTDPKDLPKVAQAVAKSEAVGADTETTSLSPRDGAARLLQLATPDETFVVDLFEVRDISPLKEVLEDGPVKVFHNCVPLDTDVLTPAGWRPIATISRGDTVMGYSEGRQRWTTVTEYVDGGEQGVIETFNTRRRWRSTASHRWVCRVQRGKRGDRTEEVYRTTDDLRARPGNFDRVVHSAPFVNLSPSEVSPDEAALMAWLWADGTVYTKGRYSPKRPGYGGGNRVPACSITQSENNRDYCTRIETLLRSLGVEPRYGRLPESPHIRRYTVPGRLVVSVYEKAGADLDDPDYEGFVLGLSKEALAAWFEAFWFAEGSKSRPFPQVFCQTRKANPGKFEALLLAGHLLGHTPKPGGEDFLNFGRSTTTMRKVEHRVLGTERVACLRTESSNFVMRQGDFVTITGNCKFDFQFLKALHGISLSPVFDTMLAAQLLDGGRQGASYSLEAVAERYLDEAPDKSEQRSDWSGGLSARQLEYAARDAAVLVPLREKLLEALEAEELIRVSKIEFAAVSSIAEMELAGVKLDVVRWKELEKTVRERRDAAALALEAHFPEPEGVLPLEGLGPRLNLNSPQQITDAFRSIGVELPDTKVWTLLKVEHPAAKDLLRYRELQKKLGTYLETYPKFIHPKTGRIHASFLQCRVPTGRLACASPNIQQIPHEDEFRRCFVAENGYTLVIADYSQIELRILAEVSGDPAFVDAFQKGEDLHSLTAATMYGVPMEDVTKDQRSDAKRINFGLMYGRGARSLSAQLGTDEARGRELIDEYFNNYPKVQRFLQRTANRATRDRTLRTLAGRIRKFGNDPVEDDRGAMRREAMNYPIQGCVLGDTRLFEERLGYVQIRSLAEQAVSVWDGERFSEALVVPSGRKRLVRVLLKGGHVIECSPDHKFLVRNNNGGEAWKTADEVRAQERVVLADGLGKWELDLSLLPVEPGRSWNANNADLNEIGTREELGEWLGRVASDGGVSEHQIHLLVAEHEEVLLPKLLSLTRRLGHVTHSTRVTEHQPKRLHKLTFSCRGLAQQMRRMGIKGRIPDVAWWSRSVLCGYLRGLFDGDGTSHPDGPVLTFGRGDKHLRWAREVQEALLLLGIRSRIGVYDTRVNVRIMKKDVPLFCSEVGFMNPTKQKKAEAVVSSSLSVNGKLDTAYGRAQKVQSVEVTDDWVEMYDVVNSETGKFAANGIVTHNSSADIAKLALAYMRQDLEGMDARLVNSIHDEFVVECREDLAPEASEKMRGAMTRAGERILEKVPVEVEVVVSREWTK